MWNVVQRMPCDLISGSRSRCQISSCRHFTDARTKFTHEGLEGADEKLHEKTA
jgi:hypothetical protein